MFLFIYTYIHRVREREGERERERDGFKELQELLLPDLSEVASPCSYLYISTYDICHSYGETLPPGSWEEIHRSGTNLARPALTEFEVALLRSCHVQQWDIKIWGDM